MMYECNNIWVKVSILGDVYGNDYSIPMGDNYEENIYKTTQKHVMEHILLFMFMSYVIYLGLRDHLHTKCTSLIVFFCNFANRIVK